MTAIDLGLPNLRHISNKRISNLIIVLWMVPLIGVVHEKLGGLLPEVEKIGHHSFLAS